jgi:hypothetical protein
MASANGIWLLFLGYYIFTKSQRLQHLDPQVGNRRLPLFSPWLVPPDVEPQTVDKSRSGFSAPHFGHFMFSFIAEIPRRISNLTPQLLHLYSYTGIGTSLYDSPVS